jgi:hypothetical protein
MKVQSLEGMIDLTEETPQGFPLFRFAVITQQFTCQKGGLTRHRICLNLRLSSLQNGEK